ncbi:histidine kinase dimerization/phosphoacceptor domain -containing protein [Aliihoeflea sp. 2WW]|uniref:histidine kinase dimerization/phosphoacceptor domain -containing protein n=1 Tax=Aliihoeflea sp. 2WW TaxID=1381123 RepID=UPI001378CF4D|nr:histidine kinase dimerization/phosphoacceptor domain -containing protein [Aliihoeflea sp. 2WW]
MTDDLHAEQGKGDPFAAAIRATRMAMLITDPRLPDNPIVFVNEAFLRLTGYGRDEVMGQNCRFLQGDDTDPLAVAELRSAIAEKRAINVDILNYRKDGSAFWNALYLSPVSNEQGELQFFFASQLDVTERKWGEEHAIREKERFERAVAERTAELEVALEAQTALLHEVDHRVKNNLQMVSSLIVMQARTIADETARQSLQDMLARVEALSTVHRRLYQSQDVGRFDVSDFLKDLVRDVVAASRFADMETRFELDSVEIAANRATPLALIVNELVTNALKHAFDAEARPVLTTRIARSGDRFRIEVEDNGSGMNGADGADSFGTKLIRSLSRQLKADISWEDMQPGTRATIELPQDDAPKQPSP